MALGEGVRESTLERFKEGRAPDGRRWKTSIRAAPTGGKTLIDSSQLRNSIQVTADASGFAVGTNAKHAATHQFGDQGRTIRARKAKNLRFQVGGQWVSKKQVKVNIPARPFLGLSDEDMQEIKATTEEFIGRDDKMLYKQSKEYLLEKLKAAGLKSKPYTTQKGLEKSQESHIGAVLFESETLLRNGSKTRYRDQEGAQKKRRKVFDRALTFTVIIGDYTDEAVESMFGAFLSSLDRGIYVNGDYVPIEVEGADWVDKDDSILKAQVAVQIRIRFDGGLYRDTDFAKVTDVEVESIAKNDGKEIADGN